MKNFLFFLVGLHGLHSVRFIHFIFNEQPMIGIALIVALILYLIYRMANRR